MVPSVRPGTAPSAEDRWSTAGSVSRSASPGARSDRGPPRSPLRGLAPPRPAPGPAPAPLLPPRPDRQTRAAHFLEFLPSGGDKAESSAAVVRRPKSLARDTELEPPVGSRSSRLARLCLSPGPSSGVDALAWAHTVCQARAGSWEPVRITYLVGLVLYEPDTLIAESHTINV